MDYALQRLAEIPKLCECGCGEAAPIARRTNSQFGHRAGEPVRFIAGHQSRLRKHWTVEERDCGYSTPCLIWTGPLDSHGYGKFGSRRAHRVAWSNANGPIEARAFVCHRCDNPPCVNPNHLFLGTSADNNRDRHAKGRSKNLEPGERHPKAKLTNAQSRQMQTLWRSGKTQQWIADRFGVSRGNVSKIVNGRSYK